MLKLYRSPPLERSHVTVGSEADRIPKAHGALDAEFVLERMHDDSVLGRLRLRSSQAPGCSQSRHTGQGQAHPGYPSCPTASFHGLLILTEAKVLNTTHRAPQQRNLMLSRRVGHLLGRGIQERRRKQGYGCEQCGRHHGRSPELRAAMGRHRCDR